MSAYSDWRYGALTDEEYKQLSRWEAAHDNDVDEDYWYDDDNEEDEEDDEDD